MCCASVTILRIMGSRVQTYSNGCKFFAAAVTHSSFRLGKDHDAGDLDGHNGKEVGM